MNTDSIISGLYGAANGRIDWESALRQVASELDLWVVQVVGIDIRSGKLLFSAHGGEGVNPQSALDYVRFFNTVDPRVAPSMATPPDQWMLSHEHHDDAFVASSSFYQDFLHPHGGGHMAGTKLLGSATRRRSGGCATPRSCPRKRATSCAARRTMSWR